MKREEMQFADFCKTHMIYMKSAKQFFPPKPLWPGAKTYKVKLRSHLTKKIKLNVEFSCGSDHQGPDVEMVLSCVYSDANCYECEPKIGDFVSQFGYESEEQARGVKAFEQCKKYYHKLMKCFTLSEYEDLEFCYSNY